MGIDVGEVLPFGEVVSFGEILSFTSVTVCPIVVGLMLVTPV